MRVVIEASKNGIPYPVFNRVIEGPGYYAVVLTGYAGCGYTTHDSEFDTIQQSKKLEQQGFSHLIMNEKGGAMAVISGPEPWLNFT